METCSSSRQVAKVPVNLELEGGIDDDVMLAHLDETEAIMAEDAELDDDDDCDSDEDIENDPDSRDKTDPIDGLNLLSDGDEVYDYDFDNRTKAGKNDAVDAPETNECDDYFVEPPLAKMLALDPLHPPSTKNLMVDEYGMV